MAPVSKNAKKNRGSGIKLMLEYNGKKVEVCPALFIGKMAGQRNYMAVQDKNSKSLLVDKEGNPLVWKTAKIEKELA